MGSHETVKRPKDRHCRHQQDEQNNEYGQRPTGCRAPPPSDGQPLVEEERVAYPCQERPGLLRIPLPVASPDDPRPEGTGKTAERQERQSLQASLTQAREQVAQLARARPSTEQPPPASVQQVSG